MVLAGSPHLVSYHAATESFQRGSDSPRDFLERCIDRLEASEPTVRAFTALSLARARIAADAAGARWRAGTPLSRIDGMPIGLKDVFDAFDLPTGLGSPTWDGYQPRRDSASVFALREAGAAVLGKTKTAEFAGSYASDTRNPLDLLRTPGGSSSGSAAAVAAGMLPVALGTQAIGSTLRPASLCGTFGYKPTLGAINRGGLHDVQSQSCIGIIGASLADVWHAAHDMARFCGGDPGSPGLVGAAELASAVRPSRVAVLRAPGWDAAGSAARQQLESVLSQLATAGVRIADAANDAAIAEFEQSLQGVKELALDILAYEMRWPHKTAAYHDRLGVSPDVHAFIVRAEELGIDGYRERLAQRQALRAAFGRLAAEVDAFLTLAAPGAAPIGLLRTGNSGFTVSATVLGAPALSLPVLQDEGLPLGLQLIGAQDADAKLFATAGWILASC